MTRVAVYGSFIWIYPYDWRPVLESHLMRKCPGGRNGRARAYLDYHHAFGGLQPVPQTLDLHLGAMCQPAPIIEHINIWPSQGATMRTVRQIRAQQTTIGVHLRPEIISSPYFSAARLQALKPMNRTMAFDQQGIIEPGFLKMAIHIAGEHGSAQQGLSHPSFENLKPAMRHRLAVHGQPMPIKPPGKPWIPVKRFRRGNIRETDILPAQGGIGVPETILTPEIGQA